MDHHPASLGAGPDAGSSQGLEPANLGRSPRRLASIAQSLRRSPMSTSVASSALAGSRAIPRSTGSFPAIVGFYFSFRLLSVLIAVRLFHADPQFGVLLSLGFNFLFFALAAFDSLGPGLRTFRSFASTR